MRLVQWAQRNVVLGKVLLGLLFVAMALLILFS